jgi:hypothetical protein
LSCSVATGKRWYQELPHLLERDPKARRYLCAQRIVNFLTSGFICHDFGSPEPHLFATAIGLGEPTRLAPTDNVGFLMTEIILPYSLKLPAEI